MGLFRKLICKTLNQRINKFNSIYDLPNNPNVIVNATFHIGDYLAISPIIEAIRTQWDNPKITVLCTSKNEAVVRFDSRVNCVVLPDKAQWYKYPSALKRNIKIERNIDLIIEPASLDQPHRSIVGFVLKPNLSIGIDCDKFKCLQQPIKSIERKNISQPQLYANMMLGYGFKEISGVFKLFEDKDNNLKIKNKLESLGIDNYVVFNPFASSPKRSLSIDKSKEIINKLAMDGFKCLLPLPSYVKNKSEWDHELNSICDVFHVNSIHDTICTIKYSIGVVSVDTAIIHIASVYDVPTIGLYTANQIDNKYWHPQSSQKHIALLSAHVNKIVNTEIFNNH